MLTRTVTNKSNKSLISSYTMLLNDYSCFSWCGGLSKALKYKLQVNQDQAVMFILDFKPMTRIDYSVLPDINIRKKVKVVNGQETTQS